jgi:hypothetical protein
MRFDESCKQFACFVEIAALDELTDLDRQLGIVRDGRRSVTTAGRGLGSRLRGSNQRWADGTARITAHRALRCGEQAVYSLPH